MQVSYARTSIIAYNSIDCLALIPECLTMHLIKTINLFHIDFKQIISSSTRLWTWHAAWSSKLIESHKCQDSTYTSKVVFLNQHSCWRYWRGALCPSVTSDFFFLLLLLTNFKSIDSQNDSLFRSPQNATRWWPLLVMHKHAQKHILSAQYANVK